MELGFDLERSLRLKENVGKYVKVKSVDSNEYEGWLKCVDPMSGDLVLLVLDDSMTAIRYRDLIMGDAYISVEALQEADEQVQRLLGLNDKNDAESHEDVTERKNRLIAWIKKNRLPFFENDEQDLIVAGNVTVSPPYHIQHCSSVNPRTLRSIRRLIATMPSNVE